MELNKPTFDRCTPYASYALLAAVLLVVAFVRMRFLSVPLERDEGEYAYAGQLILNGFDPYRFCYTMKLPGTAATYALIMAIFGQTPAAIHFGLLLVNSGTAFLLYLLGRRLFGPLAGTTAGACYAVLSLSPSVLGLAAHATQFVVLPVVGGLLLLLAACERAWLRLFFVSGLLLGLAFVMKQPGLFFVIFALGYLVLRSRGQGMVARAGAFLAGAILPFAITCLAIAVSGDFNIFWFWVYDYAGAYNSVATDAAQNLQLSLPGVFYSGWPFWGIALFGLIAPVWDREVRKQSSFLIGLLLFSIAALSVGFYFRKHYFVLLLPALSLLNAAAFSALVNLAGKSPVDRRPGVALLMVTLAVYVLLQTRIFFVGDPQEAIRGLYLTNPFTEAPVIADYLEKHSTASDRIAVLGSEPEIYFYAHRRSATGYIYMYPLMEAQPYAAQMQKEIVSQIEAARPKFLVFVTTRLSWLPTPSSDMGIRNWSQTYARDHYRMIGVADMRNGTPEYHWQDAEHYQPYSLFPIFIFERKD